jgi:DNA-binding NarL/FixJ family response regulator
MDSSNSYILLLRQHYGTDLVVQSLSNQFEGSIFVAHSADQAVARIEQSIPYLVILSGTHQNWSPAFVDRLRETVKPLGTTIVALTQSHEPNWQLQEEHPGIDGFLVEPISNDVLNLLVESAVAKAIL